MIKIFLKKIIRKAKIRVRWSKYSHEAMELWEKNQDKWVKLSADEERIARKKEKYQLLAFKNLTGVTGAELERFITNQEYTFDILPRLNPSNHDLIGLGKQTIFTDKNYFELLFPQLIFPVTVLHRINGLFFDSNFCPCTKEEALMILNQTDSLVFKVARGSKHGKGVKLLDKKDYKKSLESFDNNYIVQKVIKQHDDLAYYNDTSVNILRVITVLLNGVVYVISAKLRVGAPGSFCDHLGYNGIHSLDIPVNEDGSFASFACDCDDGKFVSDVFGKKFLKEMPKFSEIVETVMQAHMQYPDFGLLGWDMTVDSEDRIICMEVNSIAPTISGAQYEQGPIFYKKTKDGVPIIEEIMKRPLNYNALSIL